MLIIITPFAITLLTIYLEKNLYVKVAILKTLSKIWFTVLEKAL